MSIADRPSVRNTPVKRGQKPFWEAVRAAELGWAVARTIPGQKHPWEKWAALGYREPEKVKRLWAERRSGTAVLCGPSDLVCLDIDPPHGDESLETLLHGRELPETFEQSTPSGGRHLVFLQPESGPRVSSVNDWRPGIDVKGDGGLFILHDPDKPYELTVNVNPAELPDWLSRELPAKGESPERSGHSGSNGSNGSGKVDVRNLLEPGKVHDTLRDLAWMMRNAGLSRELFLSIPDAVELAPHHNGEPYTRDEIEHEWDSADGKVPPSRSRGGKIRDGAWLDKQVFEPLRFLVPELVPEGFSELAGSPKSGKSVLFLQFGLTAAAGGEIFGLKCKRAHVLYLALEDSDRRIQSRAREILGGEPIPKWFQFKTKCEPGRLIRDITDWLDGLPDGDSALVLVDTLGKVLEPPKKGETVYDRDYRIASALWAVATSRPGTAIVASRHTRKARSDDFLDLVSGTQGIAGAADTVLVLSRKRSAVDGLLQLTGRDLDDAEYALTLERPYGWQLDDGGSGLAGAAGVAIARKDNLGERSEAVVAFVNSHPDGVTAQDVAGKLGISVPVARVCLSRMADSGRIKRRMRGLFGPNAASRISRSQALVTLYPL
jgi:hypothetical protein